MFRTVLPIYAAAASLDGVNFARQTVWEDSIDESKPYLYYKARAGKQFIREATHLSGIPSNSYQFLISSNVRTPKSPSYEMSAGAAGIVVV